MQRSESERDFQTLMRQKWALVILSVLAFLTSVAMFSICIWIRFDLDFWEWVVEIDWYTYWYCMYVIMIAMVIVAVTNILLTYGTINESHISLVFGLFLSILAIILEFIGAIVILVYGVEESDVLIKDLKEVFFKLIYRMDWDERANRILKIVQEYVRCCGANGSEDYIAALKPVPMECRDRIDGGEYPYGCAQNFAWWLEPWSAALAGTCIVLIVVHIIQLVLIPKITRQIRKYDRANDYDYDYD